MSDIANACSEALIVGVSERDLLNLPNADLLPPLGLQRVGRYTAGWKQSIRKHWPISDLLSSFFVR